MIATKRFPFALFPRGIFAVAFSKNLNVKKTIAITFMGHALVLFRTESGAIGAIEKYCPHLGANLACGGSVKNETLQCPFHGLRFNKDGIATATDYENKTYNYTVNSWQAFEKYGMIFLLNNAALDEFNLPSLDFAEYATPITHCFKMKSHPQEILENSVDLRHFTSVHHYSSIKNMKPFRCHGNEFYIDYEFGRETGIFGETNKKNLMTQINIHAYGLGFSKVEIKIPKFNLEALQMVFPTPIDGEYIHIRTWTSIKIPDNKIYRALPYFLQKKITSIICQFATKAFLKDFLPDLTIWENKKYIESPHYLKNDGDFIQFRNWAKQFY